MKTKDEKEKTNLLEEEEISESKKSVKTKKDEVPVEFRKKEEKSSDVKLESINENLQKVEKEEKVFVKQQIT
jgi:hypothetical protein